MRTAICGVWHVHAPDYTKHALQHGEVLGFYEENDKLAAKFQEKFGLPRFESLDALLESEAEGVIVCSATCDHASHMVRIANAGKHIFTEKVLALTTEDCLRIGEAVKRNGVKFAISLFQKYLGSRLAVKAVADSGELGKINYLRFRNCHSGSTRDWLPSHFYNARQCGGGAMIDLGAHGMYLAHWLLGLPKTASSVFTVACGAERNRDRVEDNAVTVMGFEGGAIAVNETGFVSNASPVVLEVFGENGYVRMEGDRIIKCVGKTVSEVRAQEDLPLPIVQFLTGEILPGCGMEEATALTRMMEMAYNT